jgi:hypothetical protein
MVAAETTGRIAGVAELPSRQVRPPADTRSTNGSHIPTSGKIEVSLPSDFT